MPVNFEAFTPKTLEEAVDHICSSLTGSEVKYLRSEGAISTHHGFGTMMRNYWGLWEHDSPLAIHFREEYGIGHADDMSGLILTAIDQRLNSQPQQLDAEVESYKDHWAQYNIDPLTQKPI
jgi:hypothetical protein